ncbi:MAG: acylneuraminate cytidylyltransferase family protein [Clostridia bacterium]|nr:acylneuraminate cytidylyltransferase family protein [Clostridia bacterium]
MYQGRSVLGLIPARAGSKGLPGKNLRRLAGKPLIVHTIEAALGSGVLDYLLVSTDSSEIASVAAAAGAAVPFLRPAHLATDEAKGIAVVHHAMAWCESAGMRFSWVMVLQPTSPLRSPEDIRNACSLMVERQAEAVVSVCEVDHHPWLSNTLPEDGCMDGFLRPEVRSANRQELPKYYRLNGAIYLADWGFIRSREHWYGPRTYAYVMPKERSVDIDDAVDFALAEVLAARLSVGIEA